VGSAICNNEIDVKEQALQTTFKWQNKNRLSQITIQKTPISKLNQKTRSPPKRFSVPIVNEPPQMASNAKAFAWQIAIIEPTI
jgi:hypothetical protein